MVAIIIMGLREYDMIILKCIFCFRYLIGQLGLAISAKEDSIFEGSHYKKGEYTLKNGIKFHFFSSQCPCMYKVTYTQ